MRPLLGIYFGPQVITIVEAKGKKILNSFQIPVSILADKSSSEEKVPEEIKLAAVLKEELKKNKIDSNEAVLGLSGIDLIIRTFEIPVLSANERGSAMSLEVKKYIPFKIEDLISDFQFSLDGANRRYNVLFAGLLKETLEKYFNILKELRIKITAIEYSAFSLIKLISLTGLEYKGVTGIIAIDTREEGAADFTVVENGFPLFSRDIRIRPETVESADKDKPRIETGISDKLKTELRVSLEYYKRKFPAKQINNIYYIGEPSLEDEIKNFTQELCPSSFKGINISRIISKGPVFSLNFLKAYCAAVGRAVKTNINLNILFAWEQSKKSEYISRESTIEYHAAAVFLLRLINPRIIVLAALICAAALFFSGVQKQSVRKAIDEIIVLRPALSAVSSTAGREELLQLQDKYSGDIKTLDEKIKKQCYLTPELSVIVKLIPQGMWLSSLNFDMKTQNKACRIEGFVYLEDNMREVEAVNNFVNELINDEHFSAIFKNIGITNIDTQEIKGRKVTYFLISTNNQSVLSEGIKRWN